MNWDVPAALAGSGLVCIMLAIVETNRSDRQPKGPLSDHDREPVGTGLFIGGLVSLCIAVLWIGGQLVLGVLR